MRRFLFALAIAAVGSAGTFLGAADPFKSGPSVRALAYSPDGKFLAATSAEPEEIGHATVWEMPAGKLCFTYQEPKGIPAVAFSPDGKWLVLGSFSENAVLVDAKTWTIARRLPGHGKAARGLAFDHDGKTLAVSSYDGYVRLWDVASWTLRKTLENAHADWVYAAAFSKDGKTLATCSSDRTAKLWDLESDKCLHTFEHQSLVRRILFMPDDRHVVYTSWDGSLAIRDRDSGKWVVDFDRYGSGDDVAITKDGKMLAVVSESARVFPIDLQPMNETATAKLRKLMAAWDDDDIRVRDRASKEIAALGIPALAPLRQAIKDASSPESRLRTRLAMSAIGSAEPLFKFRHPEGEIQSVAFAPDAKTLATGGADGIVRLWNMSNGQQIGLLRQFPPTAPKVPRSEY
jgi:WD40 repeat protein